MQAARHVPELVGIAHDIYGDDAAMRDLERGGLENVVTWGGSFSIPPLVIARRPKADEAISPTGACTGEERLLRFARNDSLRYSPRLRNAASPASDTATHFGSGAAP